MNQVALICHKGKLEISEHALKRVYQRYYSWVLKVGLDSVIPKLCEDIKKFSKHDFRVSQTYPQTFKVDSDRFTYVVFVNNLTNTLIVKTIY